jgi:hypothetical protein
MKDVAEVAAEWLDAVSGVVHQWFQYRDCHVPAERLIEAIDELMRVHPAYNRRAHSISPSPPQSNERSAVTKLPLRYVNEYRDVRGKVRRYFRRPGYKRIPLPGLPGSDEFMSAYQAALGQSEPSRDWS